MSESKQMNIGGCDTLPKLFLKNSAAWGDRIAMREKDFGIWQGYSWNDYRRYAGDIAHGLLSLGLQRQDVVSILSEDCKEWLFADVGGLLAGAVVNGIYPTYQSNQVEYTLLDSACRFLFVEDEEQLDKYLEVEDQLPGIEKVFVFDWKGLRDFKHDKVRPIEFLYEKGAEYGEDKPSLLDDIAEQGGGDDLAILIYTSGTTGRPKGAMLSQRYIVAQMMSAPKYIRQTYSDEILTYLPLCHVAERVFSGWLPIAHGATINFAESPETVMQNLQELSPTYVFAVPRVWEKFYSRVTTAMSEATWIGRKSYELAIAAGTRRAEKLLAGETPTLGDEIRYQMANLLVFRNIKSTLGLNRVHSMATGAAPISKSLLKWYLSLGLPLDELYGQTETGIVTTTRKGVFRLGTVGPVVPPAELKIDANGEILIRSPFQFDGYLNLPDKTASTIIDGWVHTGDIGSIDDEGNLSITDRLKDIIITAGGKNITPSLMENELKFSPYISDAVVVGDRRKYLTCLIMIDQENVEHYAQTHAIPFTDYKSLCARAEIVDLIDAVIARVNKSFSQAETVKKFRLIDVLLTAEDEELTPTMKLKRGFVNEKYSTLIESMYGP